LGTQLEKVRRLLGASEVRNRDRQLKIEELNAEISSLEQEMIGIQQQISSGEPVENAPVASADSVMLQLRNDKRQLSQQLAEAQTASERLEKQIEDQAIEHKKLMEEEEKKRYELEFDNQKLSATVEKYERDLQKNKTGSASEIDNLKTQIETNEAKIAELEASWTKTKDEKRQQRIDLMKSASDREIKMRSEHDERTKGLREEIEGLQKKLDDQQKILNANADSQMKMLQDRITQLEAENKKLYDQLNGEGN